MKLTGATLLETLVATTLFLIIFSIAIDSLVKVNRFRNVDWIAMERDFNKLRELELPARDTSITYPWGEMCWEVADAYDVAGLKRYTVTACMRNGRTVVYHFLKD